VRIHIVQKGDTLWKIARQHGISFEDLKRLNAHLANPDYIVPGMEIILPDMNGKNNPNHSNNTNNANKVLPKSSVKEYAVREHAKEFVKEQPIQQLPIQQLPIKEQPVKEFPIKEAPVKEIPLPIPAPIPIPPPAPQPAPMPPYIMPIMPPPAQPVQPLNIDFYNMLHMPDVNVQMDMQIPQMQPQPIPVQLPAPPPEIQYITRYVPVPVPVPVHVHPPCGCHERPPHQCGCKQLHPLHQNWLQHPHQQHCEQQMHHHHRCEQQMPVPTPYMHDEDASSILETMPAQHMPYIDEDDTNVMEGWRFPESSSCSSSSDMHKHRGMRGMPGNVPPGNVQGSWTQYPQYPYHPHQQPMHYPHPPSGCHQCNAPYEHGWTGQPPIGGSPWMMPYQ